MKLRSALERGLSLVEVMIAIALLSIALVTLLSKIHGSIDLAKVAEYQNAARELAKQLMADIEAGTVEDVLDGTTGNFGDPRGNYPELTWMIGRGDSSSIGSDTLQNANNARLYDKRATSGNPFGIDPSLVDPYDEAAQSADEPFTRIRIVVSFPTTDPEKLGTFVLEKMLPTECVNGTRGLLDKKEKDAAAAASGQPAGSPAGGSGGGGNSGQGGGGNTNNPKVQNGGGSGSSLSGGGPK